MTSIIGWLTLNQQRSPLFHFAERADQSDRSWNVRGGVRGCVLAQICRRSNQSISKTFVETPSHPLRTMANRPSSDAVSRSRQGNSRQDKPVVNQVSSVFSESLMGYVKSAGADEADKDLTICDIIGEWGLYQWSLVAFAALYSGMFCTIVVVGPIWTPDMAHRCINSTQKHLQSDDLELLKGQYFNPGNNDSSSTPHHQCYIDELAANSSASSETHKGQSCEYFVYDDESFGRMLTNSVSVCSVQRSTRRFPRTASLVGCPNI